MNLEFPFDEPAPSELDDRLASLDRTVDDLFLEEVDAAFERLRADPPADTAA